MLQRVLCFIARNVLKLRYKIKINGIKEIQHLAKEGGVLFLPNHPSAMDPVVLFVYLHPLFKCSPIVADTFFEVPIIGFILKKIVKAKGIPNLDLGGNDYTKMLAQKSLESVSQELKKGFNFLIYPAGKLKRTGFEEVGGASGVYQIVQESKEAKVVLIRTSGFWGSSFSKAQTGQTPDLLETFAHGLRTLLANLLFFCPKRQITLDLFIPKNDFHQFKDKLELNQYLDNWYNLPFRPVGEPLNLVRECFWSKKLPEISLKKKEDIDISEVETAKKNAIISEVARIAKRNPQDILLDSNLARDIGLDSLDLVELIAFLDENYNIKNIHPQDLNDVKDLVATLVKKEVLEEGSQPFEPWPLEDRLSPSFLEGDNLVDVFIKSCQLRGSQSAVSDDITGTLSYQKLLKLALLLSKKISALKGENIGILMPASITALLLIVATLLANKKPVMLNWTLGSKNLKDVVESSSIEMIVTSSKFLQKARVMDLKGVEHLLIFVENIKKSITFIDFLKALYLSRLSGEKIKKALHLDKIKKDDIAVYLFTSGTENRPKGVPLTHNNILSNLRDAFSIVKFDKKDVLYCFLPPFHSFGFSTTCLFPVLAGIRVAFSPDPTDGLKLAKGLKNYSITILCAAPTFLNALFRYADKESLKKVTKVISGAEKASKELYEKVKTLTSTELLEGYGITECSPILTLNRPGSIHGGVGMALPSVKLMIGDISTLNPLNQGQEGLILVQGPNIFNGYLQKDIASPFVQALNARWYNTQDLGYLDVNNNLILSGRLKRFVKIGGEMVNLVSIEEELVQFLQTLEIQNQEGPYLAIIAKEIEGQRPELILYTNLDIELLMINEALRNSGFSSLIKISQIKKINQLPLLGTGKINYRELQNL
jgi:acyl carrier protein